VRGIRRDEPDIETTALVYWLLAKAELRRRREKEQRAKEKEQQRNER
jgi:hypothetical protein